MAGQRQKHPDALAFRRGGRYKPLEVVDNPTGSIIPPCPKAMSPEVRQAWGDLWISPLAGAFKQTDMVGLHRWLWYLNQWFKTGKAMEKEGIVMEGANGGPVLNPRIRYLKFCESSLRDLEKSFGMDALARLRLGLTLAEGQTVLSKLKEPIAPTRLA